MIRCKHPCFVEKTEIPQSRGEFGEKLFANTAWVWKTRLYIYEEVSLKTLRVSGAFSWLYPLRRILAKTDPEILCHTLKIAPGSVANGLAAKLAVASVIARPLFCIPTSIAMAVAFVYSTRKSLEAPSPSPMPARL